MIEIQRQHAVRQFRPLRAITGVHLVSTRKKRLVDAAIGTGEVFDRFAQQALNFQIGKFLRVVAKRGTRLLKGLFDNEFPVQIGEDLPAPGFEHVAHAQQIPALLGLGLLHHVDQILSERRIHVTPLLRSVVAGNVEAHAIPCSERGGRNKPLLRVPADKTAIELG